MQILLYIKIISFGIELGIFFSYLYILMKIRRAEEKSHSKIHTYWRKIAIWNIVFIIIALLSMVFVP